MAEFKFSCPTCNTAIVCDELWCGQQTQCPSCQAELVVPHKQAASANPLVPPPPPAGASPKLALSRHQSPAAAAEAASGKPQTPRVIPGVKAPLKPPPKKSPVLKWAITAVVLAGLGAGGFYGYDFYEKKKEAKQRQAEQQAAEAQKQEQAAKAAEQAANKPLPVVPPTWTLDVASAKIPEGRANGMLAGTNFVVETAQLSRIGAAQVVFLHGSGGPTAVPDLALYLHLAPGETLNGHTWTISQDMKGTGVPQILKRYRPDPRYAPQSKFFSTGYAMKLEMGQTTNNAIPAKLFLALPDPEQSVVAGILQISTVAPEATAQPVMQQPTATQPVPGGPDRAAFDKRYGVRR